MAAELQQPPDDLTAAITTTTATTPVIITTEAETVAITTAIFTAQAENNAGLPLGPLKRQRRPSVRLGEIGDQPAATLSYDLHVRRTKQQQLHHLSSWRAHKDPSSSSSKSIKARSLTNLVNGNDHQDTQEPEDKNQNDNNNNIANNLDFGHRKAKAKRGTTKRVRINWVSKLDEGEPDGDEGFRVFDPDSDSPFKDQSPVHSVDNVGLDSWHAHRRQGPDRGRASESRENELDYNPPESDSRDRGCGTSEGVMMWLIDLGLSRYAPVFEIHEVDDEVLPMLTLEDLKDMGINAV